MFPNLTQNTAALQNDKALAAHMRTTFNYMTGGVALSGLIAYLTLNTPALLQAAMNPATQIIFLAVWFGLGFFFHKIAFRVQPAMALALFAIYCSVTGFALAPMALMYASMDITMAFLAASGVFLASSLYGYTTGKSLAGMGSFLAVGGIALLLFAVVLIGWSFFGTPPAGLSMVFSFLVVPFVTLAIAFKINMIRDNYYTYAKDEVMSSRIAIMNALGFYTDFVVLFLHLLRIIAAFSNNR